MTVRFIEYWDPRERSYPMHFGRLGRRVWQSAAHGFAALEVSREWLDDGRVSDALFALERDLGLGKQALLVVLNPVRDGFRSAFPELQIETSDRARTGHAWCSGTMLPRLQAYCRRGAQYEGPRRFSQCCTVVYRAEWTADPLAAILFDPGNLNAMISQFEDGRRLIVTKALDRMQGLLPRFLFSVPASAADAGDARLQFHLKPANLREVYPYVG